MIKTHMLFSTTLPIKSCLLLDKVQKCFRAWQATHANMAHALHAGYLRLKTHTHRRCNTFCFPLQQWLQERTSMLLYTSLSALLLSYSLVALNLLIIQEHQISYVGSCATQRASPFITGIIQHKRNTHGLPKHSPEQSWCEGQRALMELNCCGPRKLSERDYICNRNEYGEIIETKRALC